jgi:ubiquinone/menaquinone biosynthesis C-methylase UbiE
VTVIDNSPKQLEQDRLVAARESLPLSTVEGDMMDLGMFAEHSFDLVVHPVSNVFVPDILPVWREAYRVLRDGGVLLAGITNPVRYLFDDDLAERTGTLQVKHALPYSDAAVLSEEEKQRLVQEGEPLEFGHTLADQLGGQLDAGFVITGLYEDFYTEKEQDPLSQFMATFIATRAVKRSGTGRWPADS